METTWAAGKMAPFRQGVQAGAAIAIGYMPIALAFGLLAKTTGLTFAETVLMSIVVFAGASQYISLSLLAAGTGVFEIVLTTFVLNIRHFLMSASLNEKAEPDALWKKALYAFGITDETFSVAAMKEGTINASYMFGLIAMAYGSWVVNSGIGYAAGSGLPESLQESMSIALYAMFIGLLVPALKKQRKIVWLAGLSALFNSIGTFALHLSKGWSIVLATLLSAIIVQWLTKEGETAVNSAIVWMIIGMGIVTYLPRLLPFVLLGGVELPSFWQGVLKNVPYAVLGALIIPDVFFIQDDLSFGVIGFVAAVITAWLGANVMIVVLAAVAALSLYSLFV